MGPAVSSYLLINPLVEITLISDNEMLYQQHASHTIWYQQL